MLISQAEVQADMIGNTPTSGLLSHWNGDTRTPFSGLTYVTVVNGSLFIEGVQSQNAKQGFCNYGGATSCLACKNGTFSNTSNTAYCTKCDAASYNSQTGQTSCTASAAGYSCKK